MLNSIRGVNGPLIHFCASPKDMELIDDTQDYLVGVVQALYDEGDTEKLERCIEELCSLYKIEFRESDTLKFKNIDN